MPTKKDTLQEESPASSCSSGCGILMPSLLIINIILTAFVIYFMTGNSLSIPGNTTIEPLGIKQAILQVEYDKVGGKENYDLIQKAQFIQLKDQIVQIKEFVEKQGGAVEKTQPTTGASQTLDSAGIQKVLASAALEGNKDAPIVVIEYSDTECPYCIKQYHDTQLSKKLKSQYGDAVSFAFKNSLGVNHPGTEAKALGALCAKQVGGDAAYIKFYTTVMDGTQQQSVYPVAKLPDAAKVAGVDIKKWQTCFDTKATLAQFTAETAEAQSFELNGTPGTLILNTKTGKYKTISGAYPYTQFTQAIDELSK